MNLEECIVSLQTAKKKDYVVVSLSNGQKRTGFFQRISLLPLTMKNKSGTLLLRHESDLSGGKLQGTTINIEDILEIIIIPMNIKRQNKNGVA